MQGVGFWLVVVLVCVGFSLAFLVFYKLSLVVSANRLGRGMAALTASVFGAPVGFFLGGNAGFFVGSGPLQHLGAPPVLGVPVMMVICVAAVTIICGAPIILLLWSGSAAVRRIKRARES